MLSRLKMGQGVRTSVSSPGLASILCLLLFITTLPGHILSLAAQSTSLAPKSLPDRSAEWNQSVTAAKNSSHNSTPVESKPTSLIKSYAQLPLSFEVNRGQTDPRVKFLSRAPGYNLYLTSDEAVIALSDMSAHGRASIEGGAEIRKASSNPSTVLRMKLVGADATPEIKGLEPLPGRSNYFTGSDSKQWQTGISSYGKVQYEGVYPGIDLIYYGNQQQLEYDFVLEAGANPQAIAISFTGAEKIEVDSQGDLILHTYGGQWRQHKPLVYQEKEGARQEISSRYVIKSKGVVGFHIGDYDPAKPLIIDPVLSYSTYLGGNEFDQAEAIAVDHNGNAYVTGYTLSPNFPTVSPLQGNHLGTSYDAFVLKLNAAGSALIYSTYFGGSSGDGGTGIAVDAGGNAYVTGWTYSTNFPMATPLQNVIKGNADAFVTKLNATGSSLLYSTYLGGNSFDSGYGIDLDTTGNVYLTGRADSSDFPTAAPYQATKRGNPSFKSTDGGANWGVNAVGLGAVLVSAILIDPTTPSKVYAGTENGLYKSTDGGETWSAANNGASSNRINCLAIDPASPATIVAGTPVGIYRSTNGGNTWKFIDPGYSLKNVIGLAFDPVNPSTIHGASAFSYLKSTDSGKTWGTYIIPYYVGTAHSFAIDPVNASTFYVGGYNDVFKSTDGYGWGGSNTALSYSHYVNALAVSPANPSTIYGGVEVDGVYKSTNGGVTWSATSLKGNVKTIAIDPANNSTLYAGTTKGLYKSTDGASTWKASNTGLKGISFNALAVSPTNGATVYAGAEGGSEAFVTKLNPTGSALVYSTFLGGTASDLGRSIAVDDQGNAFVTGYTASTDFPTTNPLQAASGGGDDLFLTKLNPSGSALTYSTYLGGSSDDRAYGIALDGAGNAYLAGSTDSNNFPLKNPFQQNKGNLSDAFVSKVNVAGSALVYSSFLGGSDEDSSRAIAVDGTGSAYLTGSTHSSDFPSVNPLQPYVYGYRGDAFVSRVNPAGSSIVFSTDLGGKDEDDQGTAIAVDTRGNIYIVGYTDATNFPLKNPWQESQAGGRDAFISKLAPASDLSVTMTDSPDPVPYGNNLTYGIKVTNGGELTATGVKLTDTLAQGATLISATPSTGTCTGTRSIICNLGNLNPGASATLTLVVKPPATPTMTNTASVSAREPDLNTTNNTATQSTVVNFADLSVANTVSYERVAPGSKLSYLLTITNKSGVTARSVKLTNSLPVETTFVACSALGGACGGTGNNRFVTFPSLAVGESKTVVFTVSVKTSVAEGTIISALAAISSALPDPVEGNNSSTATATVTATPRRVKNNGKIAFSSDRAFTGSTQPTGVYTVNANGTGDTLFPNLHFNFPRAPAWSPDGKKLAVQQLIYDGGYVNGIHVVNANGTGLLKVANAHADNRRTAWSPDSKKIAFIGPDFFIYLVNVDGTGLSKLPKSPTYINDLAWSPDGTKLAYSKVGDIWVMNIDGSGQVNLTHNTSEEITPSWSPDGTKLLFVRVTNNGRDVYVINANGTGMSRLLNWADTQDPVWSPDGKKVLVVSGNDLHTFDFDGVGHVQVTNNGFYNFEPSWQPIQTNTIPPPPPPPVTLYSISGRITNGNGSAMWAKVNLSGTRTGTVYPDSDGRFSIVRLPESGNYTVTVENSNYSFNPPSYTFNNLAGNQTANFTLVTPP